MDMTVEEARSLVADQTLWPRIRDFLWNFAQQIHASWLEDVPGASQLTKLMDNPRVRGMVLEKLGVIPCFHLFPKEDWSRLLLLDGEILLEIAKWLGALACADSLRRVTDGAKVRELKATLSGVYPDVFAYTAYFKNLESAHGDSEPQNDVVSHGVSILVSMLAPLPESLVMRLKFKLPKNVSCCAVPREESKGSSVSLLHSSFLSKLLKLKFPEAYRLCC